MGIKVKISIVEYIGLELRDIPRGLGIISLHLWHKKRTSISSIFMC